MLSNCRCTCRCADDGDEDEEDDEEEEEDLETPFGEGKLPGCSGCLVGDDTGEGYWWKLFEAPGAEVPGGQGEEAKDEDEPPPGPANPIPALELPSGSSCTPIPPMATLLNSKSSAMARGLVLRGPPPKLQLETV